MNKDDLAKVIVWCVAFIGICALVGLSKIPSTSLEYVLFWGAGSLSNKILPSGVGPKEGEDK